MRIAKMRVPEGTYTSHERRLIKKYAESSPSFEVPDPKHDDGQRLRIVDGKNGRYYYVGKKRISAWEARSRFGAW